MRLRSNVSLCQLVIWTITFLRAFANSFGLEDDWNGFKDLVNNRGFSRAPPRPQFVPSFVPNNQNRRSSTRCNNLSQTALLKRLKDEGEFNPTYMASTIDEAADRFQDLADKHFLKSVSRYTCDQQCVDTREQLLGRLETANKLPPADQVELRPDLGNMREEISPAVINFALHQMQQTRMFDQSFGQPPLSFVGGGQQPDQPRPSSPFFRGKRGAAGIDGEEDGDPMTVGTEAVLYCWKAGDEDGDKGLHKLCTACRSVRHLPDNYFPQYLNQVLCRGGQCLNGNGECVQQYISLTVLKNNGTRECQNWVRQTIQVSVCCDCMVRTSSSLYQLVKQTAG